MNREPLIAGILKRQQVRHGSRSITIAALLQQVEQRASNRRPSNIRPDWHRIRAAAMARAARIRDQRPTS
jgi:hypothetical protein